MEAPPKPHTASTQSDPDLRKHNGESNLTNGPQHANGHSDNSNEPMSAPTTPPGRAPASVAAASVPDSKIKVAPIGQGRETANGAKSMPGSRRTSRYDGAFGMEKLSLSAMDGPGKGWSNNDDEEVDAEGAQSASL